MCRGSRCCAIVLALVAGVALSAEPRSLSSEFSWSYTQPILEARAVDGVEFISVKDPSIALTGDIFEASHTYRLKGLNQYLTLVEAQNGHGWRYYKAYLADKLDGPWQPLAAEKDRAFASMQNVKPVGVKWTDVISHGEFLRAGCDEKLEVDPANLRFLFQGVPDEDRQGKGYGEIPWRLGLLEPMR